MFNHLGQKIINFFGETSNHSGDSKGYHKLWETVGQMHPLGVCFPYQSYDEISQIFYNKSNAGFVIETLPLVGSSEDMQKKVNGLFQHVLPEESSLQVILWADPYIGDQLEEWKSARTKQTSFNQSGQTSSSIIGTLAEKRSDFLQQQAFHSKFYPYSLRSFRCFIAYSQPFVGKSRISADEESINNFKNQLKTLLMGLGLPARVWKPEDLLSTIDNILTINAHSTFKKKIKWNKAQPLSQQLTGSAHYLAVNKDELVSNNTTIKTFQARNFPDIWSLHSMGLLIGEDDNDFSQIPCPFLIHYGVHVPKQSTPKTKVLTKTAYVEKQAFSPLSRLLPFLKREYEELDFVRTQLAKGERIVETQLSVTLLGQSHNIVAAEQILLSLFQAKEWRLESSTYLQLPMLLSSLPLMWDEQMIKSLKNMQRLKTTLSTESANLLPMQGEWQGTSSPGMVLAGRKGQLLTWSPFDNKDGNYNVCVVGKSGSGKSVFMQELMVSTLGLGGKVFVLDVGRSFEKTCHLLEGQFIEFKAKSPLCLNPFSTISAQDSDDADDALAMLKPVLLLMVSPNNSLDGIASALLEQAMRETWSQYGRQSNMTLIAQWLSEKDDKIAQDLSTMLYPYTDKGVYGRFFNGEATVNLNNNLVVIVIVN